MNISEDTDRSNKRSVLAFSERRGAMPQRIAKRRQFLEIAALKQKIVTPAFILQFDSVGGEDQQARYGFTVTKKVGNAVIRNRVKRKLRELVRLVIAPNNKNNRNMVLIGRRSAIMRPLSKMEKDAIWAMHEVERLDGKQS